MHHASTQTPQAFTVKRFLSFYKGEWLRYIVALLASLGSASIALLVPLIVGYLVDRVLKPSHSQLPVFVERAFAALGTRDFYLGHLYIFGLILIALYVVDACCQSLNVRWTGGPAERGARRLRIALFDHIQRLPFSYHRKAQTGDLIQRCLTDVEQLRRFISRDMTQIVRCLGLVIVATTLMFRMNTTMALIGIGLTPIVFVASIIYFIKRRNAFRNWDDAEGRLATMIQENISGVRVVRAFNRTPHEIEKFDAKNEELAGIAKRQFRIMGNFWFCSDFLTFAERALVILFGALFVIDGSLSLGTMIVFVSCSEQLIFPLKSLARVVAEAGKTQISCERLGEIFNATPEPDDAELLHPTLTGALRFEHVDFAYDDDPRPVLRDITFSIEKGQTIGILGATGSGKSSLLLLLQRLYEPTAGTIFFDDIPSTKIARDTLRHQIAFNMQEPFVYSRSILDNIRITNPDASDDDVVGVAKTARLHDEIARFNEGYHTLVGERGVTLSGGQKQRLTIARALLRDCPLLIFDDSLSAVDIQTDRDIRAALEAREAKATTIIVSHRIASLMHADLILVLANGAILERGTHETLMRQNGLYKRVHDIQQSYTEISA